MRRACRAEMSERCDVFHPSTETESQKKFHRKHKTRYQSRSKRNKGLAVRVPSTQTVDIKIGYPDSSSMVISMRSDSNDVTSLLPISLNRSEASAPGRRPHHQHSPFLLKNQHQAVNSGYMLHNTNTEFFSANSVFNTFSGFLDKELTPDNLLNLTVPERDRDPPVVQPSPLIKHNLVANCDEIISTLNDSGYSTEDWRGRRTVGQSTTLDEASFTDILLTSDHTLENKWNVERKDEALVQLRKYLSCESVKDIGLTVVNGNLERESTVENNQRRDKTLFPEDLSNRNVTSAVNSNQNKLSSSKSVLSLFISNKKSPSVERNILESGFSEFQIENQSGKQVYSLFNVPRYVPHKKHLKSQPRISGPKTSSKNKKNERNQIISGCTCTSESKNNTKPKVEKQTQDSLSKPLLHLPVSTKTNSVQVSKSKDSIFKSHLNTYEALKNYGALRKEDPFINSFSTRTGLHSGFGINRSETDDWDTNSQDFATARSMISSGNRSAMISDEDSSLQLIEGQGRRTYRSHLSLQHQQVSGSSLLPIEGPPQQQICRRRKCPKRRRCPGRSQPICSKLQGGRCESENVKSSEVSEDCKTAQFSIPITHNTVLGPTLDDVIVTAICSSSIKSEEYWTKIKNSLTGLRKGCQKKNDCICDENKPRCICPPKKEMDEPSTPQFEDCNCDPKRAGATDPRFEGCTCGPKRNGSGFEPMAPRLEGCNCGPSKKCQIARKVCICGPLKDKRGCICGADKKDGIDCNVPEKICNTCIFPQGFVHIRDILGPTIDESVLGCLDFFLGKGKYKCRREVRKQMSKEKKECPKLCKDPRSQADLARWLREEYMDLEQDILKAKNQPCPGGGPQRKDILDARHRVLNNLTELLQTKKELETLGGPQRKAEGEPCRGRVQKRICPAATRKLGESRKCDPCGVGFEYQVQKCIISEGRSGSAPFTTMPCLKEVLSTKNIDKADQQRVRSEMCLGDSRKPNTQRNVYTVLTAHTHTQADQSVSDVNVCPRCYNGSSSSNSDECPPECACPSQRYTCSDGCRAECAYDFEGEVCNDDCMGVCAGRRYASRPPPEPVVEEVFEPDEGLQMMTEADHAPERESVLIDKHTAVTPSLHGLRNIATSIDRPFTADRATSMSKLSSRSDKFTQIKCPCLKDAATSITPSHERLIRTSELQPVSPYRRFRPDGDRCDPSCLKFRRPPSYLIRSTAGAPDDVRGRTGGGQRRIIFCQGNRNVIRRPDFVDRYRKSDSRLNVRGLPPVREIEPPCGEYTSEFCGLHHKPETTDDDSCSCSRVKSGQIRGTCSRSCIKYQRSLPTITKCPYQRAQQWGASCNPRVCPPTQITKVLWAITRINIFQDNSKTYEVMAASEEPPPLVPQQSEGVFVVIPN